MKNKRTNPRAVASSLRRQNRVSGTSTRPAKKKPRLAFEKFSKTIREKLGHYVYRLIDPRTEETFYIGKGQGNRVFDHARAALKPTKDEDDFDLKTELVRDILKAGLPVSILIHRHGLDKNTALEVEAALIDTYPELANVQSGHGSALRGCMTPEQLKARYDAPIADFSNINAVIIKIRPAFIDERGSVYEAVRAAWRIDPAHAAGLPVVASVEGVIKGIFTDVKWRKSTKYRGRFEFIAKESQKEEHRALIDCQLPPKYCKPGQANPILYT